MGERRYTPCKLLRGDPLIRHRWRARQEDHYLLLQSVPRTLPAMRCARGIPLAIAAALLLAAVLSAMVSAQPTQPAWQTIVNGELILRPFPHAPYPHPSREHGFKGRSTTYPADPHYADSTVGVFIPAGYIQGD